MLWVLVVGEFLVSGLSEWSANFIDLKLEDICMSKEIRWVTHQIRSSSFFSLRYTGLPLSCSIDLSAIHRTASIAALLEGLPQSWVSLSIEILKQESLLQMRDLNMLCVLHIYLHLVVISSICVINSFWLDIRHRLNEWIKFVIVLQITTMNSNIHNFTQFPPIRR